MQMSDSISTHMPLARHDTGRCTDLLRGHGFLLTCLLRGMTKQRQGTILLLSFLLTCLLRGMTIVTSSALPSDIISTHMPLARHDAHYYDLFTDSWISTHMPLARHDDG